MKRLALLAAAALLGTACGTSSPPPPPVDTTVDFAWQFIRFVNDTGSSLAYSCAQAQVDNVVVSFDVGGDVVVACADNAGDGARITGIQPGVRSVFVTGRRGTAELFRSSTFTVDVQVGQIATTPLLNVGGIVDNLSVYANFRDQYGNPVVNWTSCAAVGVDTLSYKIIDVANNVIASNNNLPCTDPAGVSYTGANGIDRDNYAIRMQGWRSGTATPIFDSASKLAPPYPNDCNGQAFDHVAPDAWDVLLFDVTHNGTNVCG